ncbi:hypothetical protein C8F04DRAFT_1388488 [Mycena alexandri]|uniref:Uncharacterized protein n=1 Tax=Mycena alexandri TaxID=1745969 RepID=A0AAD6THT0_9AGAR|nr:hypothetical protein C8F04DRAFT_1388488 [Mycena alexandri]
MYQFRAKNGCGSGPLVSHLTSSLSLPTLLPLIPMAPNPATEQTMQSPSPAPPVDLQQDTEAPTPAETTTPDGRGAHTHRRPSTPGSAATFQAPPPSQLSEAEPLDPAAYPPLPPAGEVVMADASDTAEAKRKVSRGDKSRIPLPNSAGSPTPPQAHLHDSISLLPIELEGSRGVRVAWRVYAVVSTNNPAHVRLQRLAFRETRVVVPYSFRGIVRADMSGVCRFIDHPGALCPFPLIHGMDGARPVPPPLPLEDEAAAAVVVFAAPRAPPCAALWHLILTHNKVRPLPLSFPFYFPHHSRPPPLPLPVARSPSPSLSPPNLTSQTHCACTAAVPRMRELAGICGVHVCESRMLQCAACCTPTPPHRSRPYPRCPNSRVRPGSPPLLRSPLPCLTRTLSHRVLARAMPLQGRALSLLSQIEGEVLPPDSDGS